MLRHNLKQVQTCLNQENRVKKTIRSTYPDSQCTNNRHSINRHSSSDMSEKKTGSDQLVNISRHNALINHSKTMLRSNLNQENRVKKTIRSTYPDSQCTNNRHSINRCCVTDSSVLKSPDILVTDILKIDLASYSKNRYYVTF